MHTFYILIILSLLVVSIKLLNDVNKDMFTKLKSKDWLLRERWSGGTILTKKMRKARKSKKPFGVLFIDVDDFKKVNDMYGHVYGDKVLLQVAHALLHHTRQTPMALLKSVHSVKRKRVTYCTSVIATFKYAFRCKRWLQNILNLRLWRGDRLVRYGGDEFLCLFDNVDANVLIQVGWRISKQLKNLGISVSIGGTLFKVTDSVHQARLLNAADKAMYVAKEKRSKVVIL